VERGCEGERAGINDPGGSVRKMVREGERGRALIDEE
jgi:hypothetical protein